MLAKFERKTLFGSESIAVKDRIEQRPLAYHQQVRENYLAQARAEPERYRVVAADDPDRRRKRGRLWQHVVRAADVTDEHR